jgi:hypothetical protein
MTGSASRYMLITVTATLMAFGGGAVAMGASSSGAQLKACAAPHTGALRLASSKGKCPKGYRLVSWNQRGPTGAAGAAGPAGARGAAGAPGSPGPAGTVDTSQFYNKTTSDGRFLPLHGTADSATNSQALGSVPANGFVSSENLNSDQAGTNSVGTYDEDVAGGSSAVVYPAQEPVFGTLTATCNDPASATTLHYAFASGPSGSVQVQQGGTGHYYDTAPVTDASVTGTGEVSYVVNYPGGSISWIEVYATAAPGGRNTCRVRVFYQRFTHF